MKLRDILSESFSVNKADDKTINENFELLFESTFKMVLAEGFPKHFVGLQPRDKDYISRVYSVGPKSKETKIDAKQGTKKPYRDQLLIWVDGNDEIIGWGIGANVTDERRKSYWRRQPGASRKQMQDYAISSGGYAIAVSQDDSIAKLRKDRSDAKSGSDLDWRDPQEKVFQKRAEDYLDKKSKVLEAAGKKEIAILKKAFNDYMDNLVEPLKKGELYGVSDIIDMSGRSYKTHSKESFATIRAAADRLAKIGHVFWQMRSWTSNIKNASDLKRLVFDVNKAIQG